MEDITLNAYTRPEPGALIHPPPVMLMWRIMDAIKRRERETGDLAPAWIDSAIREGVRDANAAFDRGERV